MKYENPPLDELMHYGTPRHSGRYPWGSGENPYQRNKDFMARYSELHKKGLTDAEIAKEMGVINPRTGQPSSTLLKQKRSAATNALRLEDIKRAEKLRDKGYGNTEIARLMSTNGREVIESTVRNWLKGTAKERAAAAKETADVLKKLVDTKGYIDVGTGVELEMGITETKKKEALEILKNKGYTLHNVKVPQVSDPNKKTTLTVICPPGTEWKEVVNNMGNIHSFSDYATSRDDGKTYEGFKYPTSVDSKRVGVRYAEEGGADRDGTIELRRGVADIDLGNSSYAQVRIAVDNTHYIKGMAFYSDDLPKGVDILVNTNKHVGTPLTSPDDNAKQVLKPFKKLPNGDVDVDNPFGALVKPNGQSNYISKDGTEKLSAINKLREEGDWENYAKTLSSQVLSKQSTSLAKQQLELDLQSKKEEFNSIMKLNNPVVKQKLLDDFASNCDSAAIHMKAAALPRQTSKVLLPVTSLKDNEVYAPTCKNGERVVLIRYPHGGIFEIPELIVNNNNADGKRIVGKNSIDAIGINPKVAGKLSGADFDGDTAVIIPVNDKVKIKTAKSLEGLKGFEPKELYPGYEGMKVMEDTQREMGKISNLITDMTIHGASPDELARAVRHSMVVIDAKKHKLNYKLSEKDNDIAGLKKKYGERTLISQAKGRMDVPEFEKDYKPNPETGELTYHNTNRTYMTKKIDKKTGEFLGYEEKKATTQTTKLEEAFRQGKDAYSLSSGTRMESVYADYSNRVKALANETRKASMSIKMEKASPSARKLYEEEVKSLNNKLNIALKNAPKERQAQIIANEKIKAKVDNDPDLSADKEAYKKAKTWALAQARAQVGAKRQDVLVNITNKEWEAIQNKAVSPTLLKSILNNADMDEVKKLATPRETKTVTAQKINRIKSLSSMGYTLNEIADLIGVSSSTVSSYLKNDK